MVNQGSSSEQTLGSTKDTKKGCEGGHGEVTPIRLRTPVKRCICTKVHGLREVIFFGAGAVCVCLVTIQTLLGQAGTLLGSTSARSPHGPLSSQGTEGSLR
jgi:hypothetical protein